MRAAGLMVLCVAAAGAAEAPLPRWEPGEREKLEADGWVAGGLLLNYDPVAEAKRSDAEKPAPLEVEGPKEGEIVDEPVVNWVPEEHLEAYFGERPPRFLVDPQGLLGEKDAKDRLGFLNYHAEDSSIDLFVYVFGGTQEVPGAVRAEETVERYFSTGRPAAVVFYYLGAPQRSVMYLSPSLTDGIPAAEQRRAVQSSVMMAFGKVGAVEQLEAFTVQMSIRLYWMERMLAGEAGPEAADVGEVGVAAAVSREEGRELREKAGEWVLPGAGAGAAVLGGVGLIGWMRARRRYRFPEFEVEPRLGGAHAAGVGAVIYFASANVPPASQRDQVPDYLRRA